MTIKIKLRLIFTFIFVVMFFSTIFTNNIIKEIKSDLLVINNQLAPAKADLFSVIILLKDLRAKINKHVFANSQAIMDEVEKVYNFERDLVTARV